MAPLPPVADVAWKAHVAMQTKGPRYQEYLAPEKSMTINGTPVKYRQLALDKNSATYATILDSWYKTKPRERPPFQDLVNLKYTVETIGSAPADGSGYPLFLSMHGGGATSAGDNDGEWLSMMGFYKGGISHGIYVALRGIGNTWDLHFTPASYVLIERLIENFVLFGNVNANQVYILGFSAGGDGTYRIAPRLAQRFRAANAGGGHPGGVQYENVANLPICLQVGEFDSKYGRCYAVVGSAIAIDKLKNSYPNEDSIYRRDVFIHQPPDPEDFDKDDPDQDYVERHFGWERYYAEMGPDQYPSRDGVKIVSDYKNWYDNYIANVPDQNTRLADTHAIHWMTTQPGNRSRPRRVVWDLREGDNFAAAVASNFSGRGTDGRGRSQNYWLDIGHYTSDHVGNIIEASIDSATNTVNVVRAQNYLRILLVQDMLGQPGQPVIVKVANQTLTVSVRWDDLVVVAETLVRNDPNFVFTGEIVLRQREGGDRSWYV